MSASSPHSGLAAIVYRICYWIAFGSVWFFLLTGIAFWAAKYLAAWQ